MVQVTYTAKRSFSISVPSELTAGKRRLTKEEIEALEKNQNTSDDPLWQNFFVVFRFYRFGKAPARNA